MDFDEEKPPFASPKPISNRGIFHLVIVVRYPQQFGGLAKKKIP